MHIAILDDYQDCVRLLDAFAQLSDHEVVVYHNPVKDIEAFVSSLIIADVLVLTRERTALTSAVLDRLPRLRMVSAAGSLPGNLNFSSL